MAESSHAVGFIREITDYHPDVKCVVCSEEPVVKVFEIGEPSCTGLTQRSTVTWLGEKCLAELRKVLGEAT